MALQIDLNDRGLDHLRPYLGPKSGAENGLDESTAHLVIIDKP